MNLIEYRDAVAAAHERHEDRVTQHHAGIAEAHAILQKEIREASSEFLGISFDDAAEAVEVDTPPEKVSRPTRSAFL